MKTLEIINEGSHILKRKKISTHILDSELLLSKILNKSILLSDIPVHKEQNPKKASFFNLSSPVELAEKIEQCVKNYSVESNCLSKQLNSKLYDEDILEFALNFENISMEAFEMINSK